MGKMKLYILLIFAIALLPISLVGCGSTSVERPIYKASDTAIEIDSLQFNKTETTSYGSSSSADGYLDTNHASFMWYENGTKVYEIRQIGDDVYAWDSETDEWGLLDRTRADLPSIGPLLYYMYSPGRISGMINNRLDNVQILADESINGVECAHYQGDNPVGGIEEWRGIAERETNPILIEHAEQQIEDIERRIIEEEISDVWDVWIDTDDYLVRQIQIIYSRRLPHDNEIGGTMVLEGTKLTTTTLWEYFNYNQQVEIVAPVLE